MSLNLPPGEQVIFEGHPSWRSIIGFYLKGLLVAVVLGFATAGVTRFITSDSVKRGDVFVVALIVLGLTVLVGFIKRVATTYSITNRRLHIKRGIVSRDVQETRLERVQNVNFSQNVYQRLVRIGDVDFDTAGTDDSNFTFAGVADPDDVVHKVDVATGAEAAGAHGLGEAQTTQQPPAP